MPLYEEKLISPLAVRFTQEHIRPIFQSGCELESTIREIKTKPGTGDYDVILEAPFDAIEIIRWHAKRDESGDEQDRRCWFTFDNRRLYCLQRAAVALWPRRAGVVVQGLYAATEGAHRKDSSTTAGRTVGVGHSLKSLTGWWDWRAEVAEKPAGDVAQSLILLDEKRNSIEELCDAPAPPSMLDLFFQSEGLLLGKVEGLSQHARASSEESTTDRSSPRSLASSDVASGQGAFATASAGLCGVAWRGGHGETYRVKVSAEGWDCVRTDSAGKTRKFSLWYDEKDDLVWWGSAWNLYMQASEARSQQGHVTWYNNDGSWKPRSTWRSADAPAQEPGHSGDCSRAAARKFRQQQPQQQQQQQQPRVEKVSGSRARR